MKRKERGAMWGVQRRRARVGVDAPYRRPRKMGRRRPYRRGYDRRVGFYGRYRQTTNGERKFHDVALANATIATTAEITATVNIIPQGVTEVQRVGRKCTITNIGWKFRIKLPTTVVAADTSDSVRIIMYLDKQANGATAVNTDILETNDNFQSFNNLVNSGRFTHLMDRTYTLNSMGGGGAAGTSFSEHIINDSFYKKCNIPLEFNAATGAIAEIRSNNIGVLMISEEGLAAFTSSIRLRFSDN